jgi:hypothetical protein
MIDVKLICLEKCRMWEGYVTMMWSRFAHAASSRLRYCLGIRQLRSNLLALAVVGLRYISWEERRGDQGRRDWWSRRMLCIVRWWWCRCVVESLTCYPTFLSSEFWLSGVTGRRRNAQAYHQTTPAAHPPLITPLTTASIDSRRSYLTSDYHLSFRISTLDSLRNLDKASHTSCNQLNTASYFCVCVTFILQHRSLISFNI